MGKVALLGEDWKQGGVSLPAESIESVELVRASPMVNGRLVVRSGGREYVAHFRRKSNADFEGLVGELRAHGLAGPVVSEGPSSGKPDSVGAKFEGATLSADGVSYRGQVVGWPAAARVETAGDIQSRVTVTRLLATGVFAFALKKKKDSRELYLTVEGAGGAFVVDVDPRKGRAAREFAAKVNAASARGEAPAAAAAPPAGPDVVGQLRQLGELRDQGVLTDAEFEAKKAELLARM